MRREPQKWEYNREVSLYNKNDYRSKFYKGRWEKAWIRNRVQYAINKKINLRNNPQLSFIFIHFFSNIL